MKGTVFVFSFNVFLSPVYAVRHFSDKAAVLNDGKPVWEQRFSYTAHPSDPQQFSGKLKAPFL